MKILYRNAKYINADGWIDCEIQHPRHNWIPYTLDPNDTDMDIDNNELLADMIAAGDVAPYVPPTEAEVEEALAEEIRHERNYRLSRDVDPIAGNVLAWEDVPPQDQARWRVYRRALLDLPVQAGFPRNINWPTPPA